MQTIYTFSYNPAIAVGSNTTGVNWRMAYQQPLMLYKGTENTIKIVVFAPNQKVVDLTNYSVRLQIVDRETQQQFVTRTAVISNPTSGIAIITFTSEDLQGLQNRFYHVIAKLVPTSGSEEILYLDDNFGAFTPVTLEDAYNFSPTGISTDDGIPSISFTNIDQTPNSFLGAAGKTIKVNSSETALEYTNIFSGSYTDLTNKPTLFSGNYNDLTNKPNLFSGSYNDLTDKPTLFDGSYSSLTDKPTLFSGSYTDLTDKPVIPNLLATGNVVPNANVTYSLGTADKQWKDLYVSSNTIYIGGAALTIANGNLTINGNLVTGGGATNTGNITFDGVKIIGAGTASGDGNGYSTLELVPDTDLYVNNQYLVIDPTAPSHIHIRAGGPQDASSAELYLGGESNHVRVRDGVGVKLQNDLFTTNFYNFQQGVDYDTATWSTDEFGNTWFDINITDPMNPTKPSNPFDVPFYSFPQFPQNRIEVFDGTNYTDLIGNGQYYTLGNQYQLRIGITQAPVTNPTSITSMTFRVDSLTQNALLLENNNFDLSVNNDAYIYANETIQLTTGNGNFRITTDDNNSSQTWYFTAQGYMQFPQGLGPTTSKGKEGDEAGSVVFDSNYIYYCHTDYTDGIADIWKRVQWSADTW